MKLSDVITLLQAGYTKEEIAIFEKMEEPETPKPETPKPDESKPEAPKPEAPKPETNSELLDAIKELKETIQINNARHNAQPGDNAKSAAQEADDALMKVLNL